MTLLCYRNLRGVGEEATFSNSDKYETVTRPRTYFHFVLNNQSVSKNDKAPGMLCANSTK